VGETKERERGRVADARWKEKGGREEKEEGGEERKKET
jgi:hypothetical protein